MIRVRQVKVPLNDRDNLKEYISKKLKCKILNFKIIKESLDARRKPELYCNIFPQDQIISKETNYEVITNNNQFTYSRPL